MLYVHHHPKWISDLLPGLKWFVKTEQNEIFLTFDDGPNPKETSFVLDLLKNFDAKATFFLVGENIRDHPGIVDKMIDEGHTVGNHTYHHLNGWHSSTDEYLRNVDKCQQLIQSFTETRLFRPPYGRMKRSQFKEIRKDYEIVMWNVLSGDFDRKLNVEKSTRTLKKTKKGGIVVFHDSVRSHQNLKQLLPGFLSYFQERNFTFKCLSTIND
jgi:peptidoglycan/xylan/chitin deacetylase (PgdA/CDA1 family)